VHAESVARAHDVQPRHVVREQPVGSGIPLSSAPFEPLSAARRDGIQEQVSTGGLPGGQVRWGPSGVPQRRCGGQDARSPDGGRLEEVGARPGRVEVIGATSARSGFASPAR